MNVWQSIYRGLTWAAEPFVHMLLGWREDKGKEDPERLHERFGYAGLERPEGKLAWVHAASVGEVMSTLLLLEKLAARFPETHFLITSGTVTSARLLLTRLPPRAMHQFAPVDVPVCVARFMDHWQPDLALWIESELWPNMLQALRQRRIPAALLNARISPKSQRRWRLAGSWLREMLETFRLCLSQTAEGTAPLQALGARQTFYAGNLKFAALPLPDDEYGRRQLTASIGTRPVWLFASSHAGEEEIALAAHRKLRTDFPDLLTVIAPRHPARGAKLAARLTKGKITITRRSLEGEPKPGTEIYLADTLGELGLFYRLCPIVVVGGSFVPVGGHNPIEPALLGAAVGFGPLMPNFSEVAADMLAADGARQLADAEAVAGFVAAMLRDGAMRTQLAAAGQAYALAQGAVHDRVMEALQPLFAEAGPA